MLNKEGEDIIIEQLEMIALHLGHFFLCFKIRRIDDSEWNEWRRKNR